MFNFLIRKNVFMLYFCNILRKCGGLLHIAAPKRKQRSGKYGFASLSEKVRPR
jgi:hypothetical protein